MAILAIRKTAWNRFVVSDRERISTLDGSLILGDPAQYKEGNTVWFIYSDSRFTSEMVGRLGLVFARPGRVRDSRSALDADVVRADPDNEDHWQAILNAQNAPTSIRMMNGIPESWARVDRI